MSHSHSVVFSYECDGRLSNKTVSEEKTTRHVCKAQKSPTSDKRHYAGATMKEDVEVFCGLYVDIFI